MLPTSIVTVESPINVITGGVVSELVSTTRTVLVTWTAELPAASSTL